eukprot:6044827-Pleurochrysis_carterae.AAC.1
MKDESSLSLGVVNGRGCGTSTARTGSEELLLPPPPPPPRLPPPLPVPLTKLFSPFTHATADPPAPAVSARGCGGGGGGGGADVVAVGAEADSPSADDADDSEPGSDDGVVDCAAACVGASPHAERVGEAVATAAPCRASRAGAAWGWVEACGLIGACECGCNGCAGAATADATALPAACRRAASLPEAANERRLPVRLRRLRGDVGVVESIANWASVHAQQESVPDTEA